MVYLEAVEVGWRCLQVSGGGVEVSAGEWRWGGGVCRWMEVGWRCLQVGGSGGGVEVCGGGWRCDGGGVEVGGGVMEVGELVL